MSQTSSTHQDNIAREILAGVKARLGAAFDALSIEDRTLIADVATDAAGLQLAALMTPADSPAHAELLRERKHLDAQLANVAVAGSIGAQTVFWQTFREICGRLAAFALAAI